MRLVIEAEKRIEPWGFWELGDRTEGVAALTRLANEWPSFAGSTVVGLRTSHLSFYRSRQLMELQIARSGFVRRVFALNGSLETAWLDGESKPIHDTNAAEALELTEETVADYVRFFLYFLRGADGAFLLIESGDEVDADADADDQFAELALETARGMAHPLLMRGRDSTGRWLFDATICYGGRMFSASLAVTCDGDMEMNDDESIGVLGRLVIPHAPSLDAMAANTRFGFAFSAQQAIDNDLAGAVRLIEQGRITEARVVTQALVTPSGSSDAWLAHGVVAGEAGDLHGALKSFDEAVRLGPENAEAHWNAGLALTLSGRTQDALTEYRKAFELESSRSEYRRGLADAYLHLDRFNDAVGLAQGLPDASAQAAFHDRVGDQLGELGRHEEALVEYRAALELAPDNKKYLRGLVMAQRRLGLDDEPLANLDSVKPVLQGAYRDNLGEIHRELGLKERALFQYRAAVELAPQNSKYRGDLGNAYLDLDRIDEALTEADAVPNLLVQAVLRANVGGRLRSLGRRSEALVQYRAAVKLAPDNWTYLRDLARALIELGWIDDALAQASEVPNPMIEAEFRNYLANWLQVLERPRDARAEHRAAVKLAPTNLAHMRDFLLVPLQAGDGEALSEALSIASDLPDGVIEAACRNNIADILRELNRKEESLAQYQAATRLDPDNSTYNRNLGRAYLEIGRIDEAVVQASRVSDQLLQAQFRDDIGDQLRSIGRKQEALAQYQDATRRDPNEGLYRWHLGSTYLDVGNVGAALALADKWTDSTEQAKYRHHVGSQLRKLGRVEEALTQYREAIELAPDCRAYLRDFAMALRHLEGVGTVVREALARADTVSDPVLQAAYRANLGEVLRALGRREEALAQYRLAVDLVADNWLYRWGLVVALLHMDDVAEAIRQAPPMGEAVSGRVRALCENQLGGWLREFGRKDQALSHIQAAAELFPDHPMYRSDLGAAYVALDRVGEALVLADKVTDAEAEAGYRDFLGDRLRELGRNREALSQYQAAVALAPDNSVYRWDLGTAYLDLNHVDEALALTARWSEASDQAAFRDYVGDRLGALGRKSEALVQYQLAARLDSEDPVYHWSLAAAYLDLDRDRVDDAVSEYRTALALDTSDRRFLNYAIGLSRAGVSVEATAVYRSALERSSPENRIAVLQMFSQHLLRIGNGHDAVLLYKEEIQNDPSNVALRIGLTIVYIRLAEYQNALDNLDDAELYSLGRADVASWRGSILLNELSRPDEAIKWYRIALERTDRSRLDRVLDLANALAAARQWATAEELFEQAILTIAEPVARCAWGSALLNEGNYDEAMAQFESCPAVPGIADSHYYYAVSRSYLAWTLGRRNEYADSRREWHETGMLFDSLIRTYDVAQSASDPLAYQGELHTSTGVISERLEDYHVALAAYRRAIRCNPFSVHPITAEVSCYVQLARIHPNGKIGYSPNSNEYMSRARSACDRAVALFRAHEGATPDGVTVKAERVSVAQALVALGDYESARSLLLEGIKYAGDDALLEFGLGVVCAKQLDFQAAGTHFRRAVSLDPMNLNARSNWAECLLKLGRKTEALSIFHEVLGVTNRHVECLIGIAETYTAMGDADEEPKDSYAKAIKYFGKALAMSESGQGSKMLTANEQSAALYSRGYAYAKLFDAAAPDSADQKYLLLALKDFRRSFALDGHRDRAKIAADKTLDRLKENYIKKVTKGLGSILVVLLATIIFCLAQLSFGQWHPFGSQLQFPKLSPGTYVSLTFGSILIVIAGVSLPSLLRLKVAGVELEKKSVIDQGVIPLGITRDDVASQLDLGFTVRLLPVSESHRAGSAKYGSGPVAIAETQTGLTGPFGSAA